MQIKKSHIDITVIVPIYQHWDLATHLLDSLGNQTISRERCEFIIVDNGSDNVPDPSELPDFVTLLHCDKPGSYAARNVALSQAQGRLIVFTDADCRPAHDWLYRLWSAYEDSSGNELIAGGVKVRKLHPGEPNSVELYDMAMGLPQARYVKRGYAVTANLAIPRQVIDLVGGFDDTRFSGGDADFCRRSKEKGVVLKYIPDAVVYHPARSNMGELMTKLKRVKGGQVTSGTLVRRFKFIVRSFFPPVFAISFAIKNEDFSVLNKISICALQLRLWGVEMLEVVKLLLGKKPERR